MGTSINSTLHSKSIYISKDCYPQPSSRLLYCSNPFNEKLCVLPIFWTNLPPKICFFRSMLPDECRSQAFDAKGIRTSIATSGHKVSQKQQIEHSQYHSWFNPLSFSL